MGSQEQPTNLTNGKGELLPKSAIDDLNASFKCEVLVKGEGDEKVYLQAAHRYNEAGIKYPSIIIFCEIEEEVASALKFVQKWNLDFTIACGRHSFYNASTSDGLVIDLGKMRNVSINEEEMTITAGGGCRAGDLEAPLQEIGRSVVMGAMNETGIGGLTLGGGTGFLTGQHGMVADNLLRARVVLADGSIVEASDTVNEDLFWAIRGGGSNFGVVTEFTYRTHKQEDVLFGMVFFTPDKKEEFLQLVSSIKATVDKSDGKLVVFAAFMRFLGMPKLQPGALIFYDGPEETGKELLSPLLALGPMMNTLSTQPYANVTMMSDVQRGPPTHQRYAATSVQLPPTFDIEAASALIDALDAFMDAHGAAVAPSRLVFELRSFQQTAALPLAATAAIGPRQPSIFGICELQYDASLAPEAVRAQAREMVSGCREILGRKDPGAGSRLLNLNLGTGTEKAEELFGENLPRLRALKKKFDPGFIFNKWHPITPAE